jgi:hypothetical protein
MTERLAPVERLSEVARLATLLADRVLDAQIMSQPISDLQIRALLDAALVLEEHQMPLPPLLTQILHEVGTASSRNASDKTSSRADGRPPRATQGDDGEGVVGSFTRLLRSFRNES